ncbi:MAG: efflux RND transporter periplasmic adaptor subunit [Candidatus Aminicenantes bacterium]|nr:efflux RND transporter periplasmic adaptor subunit [Candidatus Aminicenantes bacterium]
MKKKTLSLFIILPFVVAAIAVGYTLLNNRGASSVKYRTEPVARGDIQATVVTTGSLDAITTVEVGSQVSGRIAKLYADFNSQVKEGQVIAELEQSLFLTRVKQNEANYRSALAALEKSQVNERNAKKSLERAEELFQRGLVSPEEREKSEELYLSSQADVKANQARLEQAQAQLDTSSVDFEHTVIKSPIDGIVISRNVNVGQTVAASFQAPVLFVIANDLRQMQVNCSVDEADIGKVKEGQQAKFTVDAFPDDTFYGRVTQVRFSPVELQNVITYDSIIEVENPELKLKPGMTATVTIIVAESKDVLMVHNQAVGFNPPLSREKLASLMQGMGGERSEGGEEARRQMPERSGEEARRARIALRNSASIVWTLNEKNEPVPVFFLPGIKDYNYTEVRRGDLEEGQLIIIGMEGGTPTASEGDRRGGFMPFGPRR